MRLQAPDAIAAQDGPQLEGTESPPQGDLPVAVVRDEVAVAKLVPQVRRLDAQRLDQPRAPLDPDGRAVKRGEHPLVRVEVERVKIRKRGGNGLVLLEQQRRAGVGGVDVHPDLLRRVGVGRERRDDAGEVVDGAHVGAAQGRRQVEGLEAPRAKVGNGLCEGGAGHGEVGGLVDGDADEADAENLGGLFGA